MFDAGKWALVPEEPVRGEILRRLVDWRTYVQNLTCPQVFLKPDGIY
jgi:hypothetical protein